MWTPILLAVMACTARQDPPDLTEAGLRRVAESVVPLIEAEMGGKFRQAPAVVPVTAMECADVLAAEILIQLRIESPTAGEEDLVQDAGFVALLTVATGLVAKYDARADRVLVIAEHVRNNRWYRTDRGLNALLLHELAHAWAHQTYGDFAGLRRSGIPDANLIRGTLGEGHAQYVTGRVLRSRRDEDALFSLEREMIGDGEVTSYGGGRFAFSEYGPVLKYAIGREFFEALERRGGKPLVEAVFRCPPTDSSVLLFPERYRACPTPPRPAADRTLMVKLGRRFDPAQWAPAEERLDAIRILALYGPLLGRDRARGVLRSFESGRILHVTSRNRESLYVRISLVKMKDPAGAAALHRLALDHYDRLLRALDRAGFGVHAIESSSLRCREPETRAVRLRFPGLINHAIAQHRSQFIEVEYRDGDLTDEEAESLLDGAVRLLREEEK